MLCKHVLIGGDESQAALFTWRFSACKGIWEKYDKRYVDTTGSMEHNNYTIFKYRSAATAIVPNLKHISELDLL